MWPQIILSNIKSPFHFTIYENVLNFSGTPCVFSTRNVWVNPKEGSQASQLLVLNGLCMWTTCIPVPTIHIQFLLWWNSLGHLRHHTGCCLEKFGEGNFVPVSKDDTTQLLCTLKPHDIFKYKFTAWAVRSSVYTSSAILTAYSIRVALSTSRHVASREHTHCCQDFVTSPTLNLHVTAPDWSNSDRVLSVRYELNSVLACCNLHRCCVLVEVEALTNTLNTAASIVCGDCCNYKLSPKKGKAEHGIL